MLRSRLTRIDETLAAEGKTIAACPPRLTRSLPLPGSDVEFYVADTARFYLITDQVCRSSSKARALRFRPESFARFIGL